MRFFRRFGNFSAGFGPSALIVSLLVSLKPVMAAGLNVTFNDKTGMRQCLDTKPFYEETGSGSTVQKHLVDQAAIRERCIAQAVKVLSAKAPIAMAGEFLQEAKKGGWSADFYDLIKVAITKNQKLCNDRIVYDELIKLYSYPGSSGEVQSEMSGMVPTVKTCLKDKEFAADFKSDASQDQHVRKNVCKHLAKEGVIPCG